MSVVAVCRFICQVALAKKQQRGL